MKKLDRKKAIWALMAGYLSLVLTKFSVAIDPAYDLYFMPGLILPGLVAIFYGWKYALLCCIPGLSLLQPFFVVPTNGWGNMATAFAILGWSVGHGMCRDLIREKKAPFVIQYLFQLIFILAFLLFYRPFIEILVKANSHFPTYAYSYLPDNIINATGTVLLEIMTICILVLNSIVMLPAVKRHIGDKVAVYDHYSNMVVVFIFLTALAAGMISGGNGINEMLCITLTVNDYQNSVGSIQLILLKEAFVLFIGDFVLHFINYYCEGQQHQIEMAKIQEAVFESSQDMIWSVNGTDEKIMTANHVARKFFEQRSAEYENLSFMKIFDKEEIDFWEDSFDKVKEEKNYQTEFFDRHTKHFYDLQMHWIDLGGGQYDIAVFAKDITDEVVLTEKLRENNDELENRVLERTKEIQKANNELENFCYTVAHELKAPLRAIELYNTMILEESGEVLTEGAKKAADMISSYCKKTLKLVSEILNYSKMKTKKFKLVKVKMDWLIKNTVEEFRLLNNGHKIEVESDELPVVLADEMLLRCCIHNIISNAVKYSSKKEITKIRIAYEQNDKEHIFHISDNGVGFDMEESGKLLQLFGRMHPDSEYEGNGIGLVTVKNIIEKHGGTLSLEAVEGEGCTVTFSIPK